MVSTYLGTFVDNQGRQFGVEKIRRAEGNVLVCEYQTLTGQVLEPRSPTFDVFLLIGDDVIIKKIETDAE